MGYQGRNLRRGRYSEINRPYLVTAVTHHRKQFFNNLYCARILINAFKSVHDSTLVESLSWVVMPDHFHWLFTLKTSSMSNVMQQVKQQVKGRSALQINQLNSTSGQIWQKGFHDYGLRCEEDLKQISRYIVANPLRASLVDDIGEYSHWDSIWL